MNSERLKDFRQAAYELLVRAKDATKELMDSVMTTRNVGVGELGYDDLRVRAPKNNTSQTAELMQCPECQSTHVNKNSCRKKVNRIIFVSVVADNL